MANRIGTFPTFANLSPPWSLPTLDSNFVAVNTFANDSSLGFTNAIPTDTGTVNAYQVTCTYGAPSAYNDGMTIGFIPANTNTGASTIQVLPLSGTQPILDFQGSPIKPGALQAGKFAVLYHVSGAFRTSVPNAPFTSQQVITVAGTTTVPCNLATQTSIVFDYTGAPNGTTYTVTLTGVTIGGHIDLQFLMLGTGQHVQFASCTDSSGNSITDIHSYDFANGAVNWLNPQAVGTQWGYLNGHCFRNNNNSTSYLRFLFGFV